MSERIVRKDFYSTIILLDKAYHALYFVPDAQFVIKD